MADNRLMAMKVSRQLIFALLQDKCEFALDTHSIDMWLDNWTSSAVLVLHSDTFAEVREGEQIPILEPPLRAPVPVVRDTFKSREDNVAHIVSVYDDGELAMLYRTLHTLGFRRDNCDAKIDALRKRLSS